VLTQAPREALQYAASEGFAPLREWVAQHLGTLGMQVSPGQVLITTGSQQGLDLVGKVMVDAGAPVAVETPTYLGALQAFNPYEPIYTSLAGDADGPLPESIRALPHDAPGTRFAYLLPNFQNPTGRVLPPRGAWPCWRQPRPWACRWSKTTRMATCGSTPRRPRRWHRTGPRACCTWAASARC
jgi:DNA-binding transcriptional MocR family regulator